MEPCGFDYVSHGAVVLMAGVLLLVASPIWVPLYVVGKMAHRRWPIDMTESDSTADMYW